MKMSNQHLPQVSIIITTFNNEQTIDECLKSIFRLNYPKNLIEVILVDGASKDKTLEIARNYPIKIISEPLNAPAAYNLAIKQVDSNIVGFIDSDAKVDPNWLSTLVTDLVDPKIAGTSGSIETWNKENKWARVIGYDLQSRYNRIKQTVIRIATMNLLMKKDIIKKVGGFDEKLSSQYDTDFGLRVTEKGYKIILNSKAKCYHFNRSNLSSYFKQQLQYGKNTIKLYFKHKKLIKGDEITDIGMNLQPPLFLLSILLFFLGFITILKPLWYLSAGILCSLFIYYGFSAVRLSIKFSDNTALLLIIIYFARLIAWSAGAISTLINFLLGKSGDN